MSKKIPLFVKITSIVLLIIFSQVTESYAQRTPRNTVAGEQTYVVRAMPFDAPVGIPNVDAAVKASASDIKGFVASGTTGLITCVTESGSERESIQYTYRLYLDEETLESSLTTNQKNRSAKLKLVGRMRIWEAEFIKDSPECEAEWKEINGGKGGLDITMTNQHHPTPLNFIVASARGRVYGPGINDSISLPLGKPGEYVRSMDTGYVKKLIPQSSQQLSPEALKKMGVKLPPGYEEQLKKSQQQQSIIPDHRLQGVMHGGSKDVAIAFLITTGFVADMLVYKPRALASNGGDGGGGSSGASADNSFTNNLNLLGNGGYITKASFNRSDLFLMDTNNSLFPNQRQQTQGSAPIRKEILESVGVQAFVNLDNDNRNDKFDFEDDELKADEDDDMIKVVIRVLRKRAGEAKKGIAQFKITGDSKYVRVWERESGSSDKLKEYKSPRDISEAKFGEFRPDGRFMIKEFWIEGREPHVGQAKQNSVEVKYFETGETSKKPSMEEKFDLTIIGIESIEWQGMGNSRKNTDVLDKDPNHRKMNDSKPDPDKPAAGQCETRGSTQTGTLQPEAVRVFPGKRRTKNGLSESKDKVKVRVKLTVTPAEPIRIFFDSFDVDDPTHERSLKNDVDMETAEEDNRGEIRSGMFTGEDNGILGKLFANREGEIEFKVSLRPGDNYRIVAAGDRKYFEQIHNDDRFLHNSGSSEPNTDKQRIVDRAIFDKTKKAEDAEIRFAEKYASKVLTVWRFFYAEVDYMDKVTDGKIEGTITRVQPNIPIEGQSLITIDNSIATEYEKITDISTFNGAATAKLKDKSGVKNAFQQGKMKIGNLGTFDVAYSTNQSPDQITVQTRLPLTAKDMSFELFDDDEEMGFKKDTDLRNLGNPDVQSIENDSNAAFCVSARRYQDAYIVPDFLTLNTPDYNKTSTVPFKRNIKADENDEYDYDNFVYDNENYHQQKDFWTVYVLFAYKGATYEDGDPDGLKLVPNPSPPPAFDIAGLDNTEKESAINGIANTKEGTGVYIFLEGCSERNMGTLVDFLGSGVGVKDALVHEIGHLFGAEHEDKGLMGFPPSSLYFSHTSINKLRTVDYP